MSIKNDDDNSMNEDPLAPTPAEHDDNIVAFGDVAEAENDPAAARIAVLETELAAAKDQTLRALAEVENTRRRAAKEREDAGAYSISRFAKGLLSVADNLRRALDAAPEDLQAVDPRLPVLFEGIEATERELLKVFEQNGIQKIMPMDEKFNPNFHEVMFEAPMPEKESGVVIQIIEAGYMLKDRLLRAAKVGVSKNIPAAASAKSEHVIDQEA